MHQRRVTMATAAQQQQQGGSSWWEDWVQLKTMSDPGTTESYSRRYLSLDKNKIGDWGPGPRSPKFDQI